EMQSLQHHPVRAAEQLDCVPALRRVGKILRHQLERYDGGGSPDGLRGDRVPLGARVLAIASTFDLLTTCASERPLGHDAALQALDTVPVGHARYPEARAAALDVERSMRRCHELVVEAMMLRAEWRDREALVTLQRAHSMWPTLTSVDVLIAATEQRLLLLGEMPGAAPQLRPAVPMIEIESGAAAAAPQAAQPERRAAEPQPAAPPDEGSAGS